MEGKITLKAEDTKKSEPKTIHMEDELLQVINFQRVLREQKFLQCAWQAAGITIQPPLVSCR